MHCSNCPLLLFHCKHCVNPARQLHVLCGVYFITLSVFVIFFCKLKFVILKQSTHFVFSKGLAHVIYFIAVSCDCVFFCVLVVSLFYLSTDTNFMLFYNEKTFGHVIFCAYQIFYRFKANDIVVACKY